MYSPEEKQFMLHLGRRAIEEKVNHETKIKIDANEVPKVLREKGACFVTLSKDLVELRGCMGHLEVTQPLYQDIIDNALAAAFEDNRFFPVTAEELSDISIEISILTPAQPLQFNSPQELLDKLTIGVDGVTVRKDDKSATYLPQVWDEILDKRDFLSSLCLKADLSPEEWMEKGVEVEVYRVEIIRE